MMKKKILMSAAAVLISCTAMAQNNTFTVNGNVKKGLQDTVIVMHNRTNDTIIAKKGKFTFSKSFEKPAWIYIYNPRGSQKEYSFMHRVFAIPGQTIEIKGKEAKDSKIYGGKFYQDQEVYDEFIKKASAGKDSLNSWYYKNANDENRDSLNKIASAKYEVLQKKYMEDITAFAKQNPDNAACLFLLNEFRDLDEITNFAANLSDNVRNGLLKGYYEDIINSAKARKEREELAKKVQAAGAEATDFTLKDINGNDFKLSSLRGKYVVLDFWGSWCGWCIKGMPQMKEYYKKYEGKFEIVGVDCGDTEKRWRDAVAKHELPWIHVFNTKGDNDVTAKYAIQGYPTKIIVDPDGKIAKTIVGESPDFYTFLDEVFGEK